MPVQNYKVLFQHKPISNMNKAAAMPAETLKKFAFTFAVATAGLAVAQCIFWQIDFGIFPIGNIISYCIAPVLLNHNVLMFVLNRILKGAEDKQIRNYYERQRTWKRGRPLRQQARPHRTQLGIRPMQGVHASRVTGSRGRNTGMYVCEDRNFGHHLLALRCSAGFFSPTVFV
ncbi:hypothetical protein FGO68_gene13464 [Halteria grandinella]|uniref:Uncharacterized protein n=1 Tax=Halteria grandinella TaxID=5974 RepID=A0A8J8NKR4_HALGN|nr:hypothetical protein FGO68_gene13464 [Halteria grandinella]